jgi:heme-degrading monooxygenase HmoA
MEIFPDSASKNVQGYQGVQLLRRLQVDEVEFIMMMEFESLDAIKFAGEDYERA